MKIRPKIKKPYQRPFLHSQIHCPKTDSHFGFNVEYNSKDLPLVYVITQIKLHTKLWTLGIVTTTCLTNAHCVLQYHVSHLHTFIRLNLHYICLNYVEQLCF